MTYVTKVLPFTRKSSLDHRPTHRTPKPSQAPSPPVPASKDFEPDNLDSGIIAMPLLKQLLEEKTRKSLLPHGHDVIIDLNLDFPGGRQAARAKVIELLDAILKERGGAREPNHLRAHSSEQYLFATLDDATIRALVSRDRFRKEDDGSLALDPPPEGKMKGVRKHTFHAIHHIWPDFKLNAFIDRSVRTVKADAARFSFSAVGEGIVWAVMKRLSKPIPLAVPVAAHGGGAGIGGPGSGPGVGIGGAAGIGSFFAGIKAAASNLLNFTTYYQMKARAGTVGSQGLAPLLREIKSLHTPLKLHFAAHSFGCRLVTSAVAALDKSELNPAAIQVDSMSLLQAAFSHYGFSDKWDGVHAGAFRAVLADHLVKGPIIATCTSNDKAVGLAYPLASILAGQVAAGVGDKHDKYGGLGRNGAQLTPEAIDAKLLPVGKPYEFQAGKIHNLLADDYVKGHSDICGEEVAYAVLAAISRT